MIVAVLLSTLVLQQQASLRITSPHHRTWVDTRFYVVSAASLPAGTDVSQVQLCVRLDDGQDRRV